MRALVACVVASTALLAATVDTAYACSCAPPEPRSMLAQVDGAFVGRLVRRQELTDGRTLFTFRVERSVKGSLGSTVDVESASNGAACGIETTVGARIGLFLDRERGRWTSLLCWQVDPEDLLAAAGSAGHKPTLLVGGRFWASRVLGLDDAGRVITRGDGPGTTTQLSVCPGGRRVAEIVALDPGYRIAIRDTVRLRVIREQRLRLPGRRRPVELLCENNAGTSLVVFARWWCCDGPQDAAVYRLDHRLTALWNGAAYAAALLRGRSYVCGPGSTGRNAVWRLELGTGGSGPRELLPGACARFLPDPTRTRLAGVAYGLAGPTQITLVELASVASRVRQLRLAEGVVGDVRWLGRDRLVFLPSHGSETGRILDLRLRTLSTFRWDAENAALVASTVFGTHPDGTLRAMSLPSGPMRIVRRLPGSANVIVPVRR